MDNNQFTLNLENILKVSKKAALYGFLIFALSAFFNIMSFQYFQAYNQIEYVLAVVLIFTTIFYLVFMFDLKPLFLESVVYGAVCALTCIILIFSIYIPWSGGDLGFYLSNPIHFWTIVFMVVVPAVIGGARALINRK